MTSPSEKHNRVYAGKFKSDQKACALPKTIKIEIKQQST